MPFDLDERLKMAKLFMNFDKVAQYSIETGFLFQYVIIYYKNLVATILIFLRIHFVLDKNIQILEAYELRFFNFRDKYC